MEGKLKFGLAGCGNIGKRHAEIIIELGILVAVCDTDKIKLTEFTTKYHCKGYDNYEVMLQNADNLQVMVICTPNHLHATQSILALNAGLHVLCEKPMALNYADCLLMIEAAKRSNKILHIVKQNRFNPPVEYTYNLIERGLLGKILSFQIQGIWNRPEKYYTDSPWKGKLSHDGGILYTQFSHFIDLIVWLIGPMDCVYATGKNLTHHPYTEFEDTIAGILVTVNGAIGNFLFTTCTIKENMEGSLTIIGEKGTIKIGGSYLNELSYHKVENELIPELNSSMPANDYSFYKGSMNNHKKVYESLIKSIDVNEYLLKEMHDAALVIGQIEKINHRLSMQRKSI